MGDRIPAFDFTRAICTLGIISFHFFVNSSDFKPFYLYENGDWGFVFVSIFFMLSGGLLYLNNRDEQCTLFYYKRWKAVFPYFYCAYAMFAICELLVYHRFKIIPWYYYILSLFGVDGYFLYKYDTAYMVGEWFLGAIVICYLIMPILIMINKKNEWLPMLVLLICYKCCVFSGYFIIDSSRNIITCLLSMQIGIIILKNDLWRKKLAVGVALIMMIYLIRYRIEISNTTIGIVLAFFVFIFLSFLGQYIPRMNVLHVLIGKLSKYSFTIYLVHHKVIYFVLKFLDSDNKYVAAFELLLIIMLSYALGVIVYRITSKILKSNTYLKIEKRIINSV